MFKHSDATGREMCRFALPILVGNILQSCYNMVDMAVVGQYVDPTALAAVSNTAMICFISGALSIGFTVGGTVMTARSRGAGNSRGQGIVRDRKNPLQRRARLLRACVSSGR